jgi:hypothetical protein
MKNLFFSAAIRFACGAFAVWTALCLTTVNAQNIVVNPNFNQGPDNLLGYEAFASWSQGAAGFSSPWALADAPVTADGGGTAVFSMNTQLAAADPFWTGATQVMSFQQNFWTPDNNAGVTPTSNLYDQIVTFTGNAQVTQAYASGNQGEAFIQFLDFNYNAVAYVAVDVSTLGPSGAFSLSAATPMDGLNIIQIGFRNSGIEGTSGQMTISNLSFTSSAIPEPGSLLLLGLGSCGLLIRRRR